MHRTEIVKNICEVISKIKRIPYNPEAISDEQYLGGDLGLDSIEMLEVWYDIQKKFGIKMENQEMIDILRVGQVIDIIERKVALP